MLHTQAFLELVDSVDSGLICDICGEQVAGAYYVEYVVVDAVAVPTLLCPYCRAAYKNRKEWKDILPWESYGTD